MVMETILRKNIRDINSDELRTLGTQISTFLGDISLSIKCTLRSNRLVVLGEHAADMAIDTESVLGNLERNIQALQIQFTQHVRLYLRHAGHKQPYAYRQFVLAPPPPPRLNRASVLPDGDGVGHSVQSASSHEEVTPSMGSHEGSAIKTVELIEAVDPQNVASHYSEGSAIPQEQVLKEPGDEVHDSARIAPPEVASQDASSPVPASSMDEQPWIVGDAELDALVHQLTALDPLENWELEAQLSGFSPDENDEAERYLEDVVAEASGFAKKSSASSVEAALTQVENDSRFNDTGLVESVSRTDEVVIQQGPMMQGIIPVDDQEATPSLSQSVSHQDSLVNTPEDQTLLDDGLIPGALDLILPDAVMGNDAIHAESELSLVHDVPNFSATNEPGHERVDTNSLNVDDPLIALGTEPPAQDQSVLVHPRESNTDYSIGRQVSHQSTELVAAESQTQALVSNLEQPFLVETPSDDTQQLVRHPQGFSSFTYETSQRLRELSRSLLHPNANASQTSIEKAAAQQPPTAQMEANGHRLAIATLGVATLGLATGVYGATRPCVLGPCEALLDAEQLGDKSHRIMRQAQTWTDVEGAVPPLNQAIEILEPIPVWSSHSAVAQDHMKDYTLQLGEIEQLLDIEQAVVNANKLSNQAVYSFDDLQTVRSLWQSAIDDLEVVPLDSPLHDFSQTYLADYHDDLANADQQLQREETAMSILDTAKQAAQLAQVRQGVAQSLENWQFARVTWIVALDRLAQVADDTLASREAERLAAFYQSSLDEVDVRVRREKGAATALEKATRHADMASAAEQRHDWAQAIADWNKAIEHIQQINQSSTYYLKAESLLNQYQDSVAQVQNKLEAKTVIEGELRQSCLGELQLCHIVSIGQSIKLKLDDSYMDAITTARGNGNYNVQAVVTDHQLMVRDSLDRIANSFNLPIEVYNPDGGLLERHIPNPLSNAN